jgi:hypothetical protein
MRQPHLANTRRLALARILLALQASQSKPGAEREALPQAAAPSSELFD